MNGYRRKVVTLRLSIAVLALLTVLLFLPGSKLAKQAKLSLNDTEFFYKVSEVRIKFILNADDDTTARILLMGNADVSGTKIR